MAEEINAIRLLAEVEETLRTTPPWETHRHDTPGNQAWLGRAANVIELWDRGKSPAIAQLLKRVHAPMAREANEAYKQIIVLLNRAQNDLRLRAKDARLEGYLRQLQAQDQVIQQFTSEGNWLPVSVMLSGLFNEIRNAFPDLNLSPIQGHAKAEVLRSQLSVAIVKISDYIRSDSKPAASHFGIHCQVLEKCGELRDAGALAEAVEKSFKVVRDRLRVLTGYEKGSEAFGKGKLHIRGAVAPHVDSDFNEGAKFLMMAIDMFRNEKSHTSDAKITDPVRAHQYLTLSSLAMSLLDDAEIRP